MGAEAAAQPHALSVTLGAEPAPNLYAELEAQLQAQVELQLGAEA